MRVKEIYFIDAFYGPPAKTLADHGNARLLVYGLYKKKGMFEAFTGERDYTNRCVLIFEEEGVVRGWLFDKIVDWRILYNLFLDGAMYHHWKFYLFNKKRMEKLRLLQDI